jgi:putrescine transport system substrate-binding protein
MTMHGWTQAQIRFAVVVVAAFASLSPPAKAQERTVNFYNWSNYMAPGVLEDFTRETGIKVVYDTFDANETLETRLLAGKSGYDVSCSARSRQKFFRSSISQSCRTSPMPGRW